MSAGNFIRSIIEEDLASGKHTKIITRFPPEPNGFLHIGHAKSICLNFGLARDFKGQCHLRFDDTNPTREDIRYIESIQEDAKWLGADWGEHLYYASGYFDQLYAMAEDLIQKGLAYVDHQSEAEVKEMRGDLVTPGKDSPYRTRTPEENLQLFRDMRAGKFKEGECVLRAKIDMAHPNPLMRDPLLYRIRYAEHPRTKDAWCIYPIYDFAHGQSDSIERITHSICTLEFEDHRPLYEWFQEKLEIYRTRQIEFARFNCTYVVMSKRKLQSLVEEKMVNDWDDPRLPTIAGLRRRGCPASAIRDLCEKVGVAKRPAIVPFDLLEICIRDALSNAPRRFAVLRPLRVTVTNWKGPSEALEIENHPDSTLSLGTRQLHFGKHLFIEQDDFQETPIPGFRRLTVGAEVRLRGAYWLRCERVEHDASGKVTALCCSYDSTTKGGKAPADGRKARATLHWICEDDVVDADVRLYDHLFTTPTPDAPPEGKSWRDVINPKSLEIVTAKVERTLSQANHPYRGGEAYQFERLGFFVADYDSTPARPVFNRTVGLIDTFAAQTDASSKEAQKKESEKAAREKAAAERAAKKAAREERAREKAAKKTDA